MFPIDIDFSRLKEVLTYDPQAPMIFSSGIFLWLFAAFMVVYVSQFATSCLPNSWLVSKATGSVKDWWLLV